MNEHEYRINSNPSLVLPPPSHEMITESDCTPLNSERRPINPPARQSPKLIHSVSVCIEPFSTKAQSDRSRNSIVMQPIDFNKKTRTNDGGGLTFNSITTSFSEVALRAENSKRPILKSKSPRSLQNKKTVVFAERKSDPSINFDDQAAPVPRPSKIVMKVSEKSIGLFGFFKQCFTRNKPKEGHSEKADDSISIQKEGVMPEIEQFSFLNINLNPWESEEEKTLRRKGRRKISSKGSPLRKSVSLTTDKSLPSLLPYKKLGFCPIIKNTLLHKLKKNNFLLEPDGKVKVCWDFAGMAFIFYEIIMIPLIISFSLDEDISTSMLEFFVDAFFIFDILLTFNTCYYRRGHLVINRKTIAKNYIHGWFWMDVVASFPYTLIFGSISDQADNKSWLSHSARILKVLRFFRFIKVIRLIRVFKLQGIFGRFTSFLSMSPILNAIMGFLRTSLIIMFIAHWIACFWHFVGSLQMNNVPNTWILQNNLQDSDWESRYIASIYWAVTTMITVGYGDITPVTNSERLFALFTMLLTSGVFAYSMNSINMLLLNLNSENQETRETIMWSERYMRKMKLDVDTRLKVRRYLEYSLGEVTYRRDDETRLLSLLSDSLKDEVIKKINKIVLTTCEGLEKLLKKTFTEAFIEELMHFFRETIYSPGEVIFQEKRADDSALYMITAGTVDILLMSCGETLMKTLGKGQHFGQISFITGETRNWTARAGDDFLSTFYLERRDFLDLVEDFPEDKEKFFYTKDKLCLYDEYIGLEFKCYVCSKTYHSPLNCPSMHYALNKEKLILSHLNSQYDFQKSFMRRPRPKSRFESIFQLRFDAQRITVKLGQNMENYMYQTPIIEDLEDTVVETSFMDQTLRREAPIIPGLAELERIPYRQNSLINDIASTVEEPSTPYRGKEPMRRMKQKELFKKAVKTAQVEIGFDKVCSYKHYFPHNNIGVIAAKMNEKLKQLKKALKSKSKSKYARRPQSMVYDRPQSQYGEELEEKSCYIKSTHDYGVGSIDFASEHSHSDDELTDHRSSAGASLQNTAEYVPASDEDIKDDSELSPTSQKLKIERVKIPLSPAAATSVAIAQNFIRGYNASIDMKLRGESQAEIKETVDTEKDAETVLKHIIEKYGANYVQQVLHEKTSREVETL